MPISLVELQQRLAARPLVLDGAMGTELERRGVGGPAPLWSANALWNAPDIVEAIHRENVAAGADILVANTFRTNPRTLARTGHRDAGPALIRLAIELARRAAGERNVLVAASVAPVEDCYSPEQVPPDADLRTEHAELASWLAAGQPDLVWIETMNTLREARVAAQAARDAGLPLAVSFVLQQDGSLLSGERLEDAVAAVMPFAPAALGLNCIPPAGLSAFLPRLRRATDAALAAYAHIGNLRPIRGWTYAQQVTPTEYADYAREWVRLGATIVGGCCGTTPLHIAALAVRKSHA